MLALRSLICALTLVPLTRVSGSISLLTRFGRPEAEAILRSRSLDNRLTIWLPLALSIIFLQANSWQRFAMHAHCTLCVLASEDL